MKAKKTYYFPQLHLLNLPLAIILKLFGDVRVFKYKGYCQRFLSSDFLPSVEDFNDVDEWRKARERAFNKLKEQFKLKNESDFSQKIMDIQIQSEKIFLQHFFKEYEQYIFLIKLAQNKGPNSVLLGSVFSQYLKKKYPELLENHKSKNFPSVFLDTLYAQFESIVTIIKFLVKMLRPRREKHSFRPVRYLFTGISPVEYPVSEISLNFAWPVMNGVVPSDQTLFVLDLEPTDQSQRYLDENKIQYVTRTKLYNSLPFAVKRGFVRSLLPEICTVFNSYEQTFKLASLIHNYVWISIFKLTHPKHFVFSFSSGWPELYEVAGANALRIKTVNWFYGTSEFGYTKDVAPFEDKSVRFSVRASQELWIWNPLLKTLIEQRSFIKSDSKIEVVGPLLNGDWTPLKEPRSTTKNFKIAVFDITPMRPRMRLQYGEGPYCNRDMQDKIYQNVSKILEAYPHVEILIKTKRAENPAIFESLPALTQLQNSGSDRIKFLPANANPYIGIQEADLVISTPYTSPSILALILGKKGLFYDPTQTARHTFHEAFQDLTIYSEEELLKTIGNLIAGSSEPPNSSQAHFPVISVEQMAGNLKRLME